MLLNLNNSILDGVANELMAVLATEWVEIQGSIYHF